jgi:hypothetical protein
MTDLTEKWKSGKLEDGDYYIKTSGVIIQMYFDGLYFEGADEEDIQEVLAPVPSYEELQQLRQLLKECKDYFGDIVVQIEDYEYTMARKTARMIQTKINAIIGESEGK